jgi:hypothetical protein
MKEQDAEINALFNKISELEIRVENQEQYSRRTNLRFHNIKVPVDERGRIILPVDTDDIVWNDVCACTAHSMFSMSSKLVTNCFLLVSSFFTYIRPSEIQ